MQTPRNRVSEISTRLPSLQTKRLYFAYNMSIYNQGKTLKITYKYTVLGFLFAYLYKNDRFSLTFQPFIFVQIEPSRIANRQEKLAKHPFARRQTAVCPSADSCPTHQRTAVRPQSDSCSSSVRQLSDGKTQLFESSFSAD